MERLSLTKERFASQKFGVAIFILDRNDRIFTIREIEEKASTGKKPGEFSVVCETREEGENWEDNLKRGLEEELGISGEDLLKIFEFSESIVWETGFVDGAWATVVRLVCKEPDLLNILIGSKKRPDMIEIIGWKTKDEFKTLRLRRGVGNILAKFEEDIFINGNN